MVKLVVGLGNPGRKYEGTRHNFGFQVVDRLASDNGVLLKRKLCDAVVGEWSADEEKIWLAKPQTFMNRSGDAVRELLQKFYLSADELVVICDDLDLPFGRIRIRPQGSAGGHRGVRSIIERIGGTSFYRVRIGIGRPSEGVDAEDYVLQRFTTEESSAIADIVTRAADAVSMLIKDGGQRAMEQFNRAS